MPSRVNAEEVYDRLLAPCCWNQTLDIHDSPVATSLRVEIAERLSRGEDGFAIEDDLAGRFGERIRAVPRGRDPRQTMAVSAMVAMGLSLLALWFMAWRWTQRRSAWADPLSDDNALARALRGEYDDQLDRELKRATERSG